MYYVLGINPDPWAIGPLGVGKKGGKFFPYVGRNQQLHAFKEAVKEELIAQEAMMLMPGKYQLEFHFWRRLDSNSSGSKKNTADATNMQKACEDALQGVLIDNDRDVVKIGSTIVEQSSTVTPCIVIQANIWGAIDPDRELPDWVMEKVAELAVKAPPTNNVWSGPNG
jgi:Holliday junction resolvase RusA-like endonuclease